MELRIFVMSLIVRECVLWSSFAAMLIQALYSIFCTNTHSYRIHSVLSTLHLWITSRKFWIYMNYWITICFIRRKLLQDVPDMTWTKRKREPTSCRDWLSLWTISMKSLRLSEAAEPHRMPRMRWWRDSDYPMRSHRQLWICDWRLWQVSKEKSWRMSIRNWWLWSQS